MLVTAPLVHILVLNWNNASDTIECLNSLRGLEYQNHRITVVDNGSTDGSPDCIRNFHPDLELLELQANLGYAEGNNAGISHAITAGADYVLVLNNDKVVGPRLLDELVAVALSHPRIGM